jgi:hypothetical protein
LGWTTSTERGPPSSPRWPGSRSPAAPSRRAARSPAGIPATVRTSRRRCPSRVPQRERARWPWSWMTRTRRSAPSRAGLRGASVRPSTVSARARPRRARPQRLRDRGLRRPLSAARSSPLLLPPPRARRGARPGAGGGSGPARPRPRGLRPRDRRARRRLRAIGRPSLWPAAPEGRAAQRSSATTRGPACPSHGPQQRGVALPAGDLAGAGQLKLGRLAHALELPADARRRGPAVALAEPARSRQSCGGITGGLREPCAAPPAVSRPAHVLGAGASTGVRGPAQLVPRSLGVCDHTPDPCRGDSRDDRSDPV